MSTTFVILLMIFCHVIADYNLQGWLASAKQKEYWEKNAPQKLYKYDYIMALLMHSISWTFMIMLPIAYVKSFDVGSQFALAFLTNVLYHAAIDHMKANEKGINLWVDQILHIIQIIITALIFLGV